MSIRGCAVKVGDRFGRLVVIEKASNVGRNVAWRCVCDCGNEKIVRGVNLVRHATRSCGCLRIDNDKGYSPNNCHFVTLLENKANQRKKHVHDGERREVIECT